MYKLGTDEDVTKGMTFYEMKEFMMRRRPRPKWHENKWHDRGARAMHLVSSLVDGVHRQTPALQSMATFAVVARSGNKNLREWHRVSKDKAALAERQRRVDAERAAAKKKKLEELKEREDSWWYPSSWRTTDPKTGQLLSEKSEEEARVKSRAQQRKQKFQKIWVQVMDHGVNAKVIYNEHVKTEKNLKNLVKGVAVYTVARRVFKALPILRFYEKRFFGGRLVIKGNLQMEGGDEREDRTEAARAKMERAKRGSFMMVGPPALRIAKMMRDAFEAEGHIWHSDGRLNLVGIRNECPIPLHFDDCLIIAYNTTDQYTDEVDKLWETGNRSWRVNVIPCTTDPGMHWLRNPSEQTGTAILQPGQYYYQLGAHGGASTYAEQYEALVQAWPVKIWRDNNRDNKLDEGDESNSFEGFFGINIHRAGRGFVDTSVDRWSAGCQVTKHDSDFSKMMDIYKRGKQRHKNLFKYTLFNEDRFPLLQRLAPRVARKRVTNGKMTSDYKWTGPTTYETFAYLSRKCIRATSRSEKHIPKLKKRPRGPDGQLIPPGEHRIPINIGERVHDSRVGQSVILGASRVRSVSYTAGTYAYGRASRVGSAVGSVSYAAGSYAYGKVSRGASAVGRASYGAGSYAYGKVSRGASAVGRASYGAGSYAYGKVSSGASAVGHVAGRGVSAVRGKLPRFLGGKTREPAYDPYYDEPANDPYYDEPTY